MYVSMYVSTLYALMNPKCDQQSRYWDRKSLAGRTLVPVLRKVFFYAYGVIDAFGCGSRVVPVKTCYENVKLTRIFS